MNEVVTYIPPFVRSVARFLSGSQYIPQTNWWLNPLRFLSPKHSYIVIICTSLTNYFQMKRWLAIFRPIFLHLLLVCRKEPITYTYSILRTIFAQVFFFFFFLSFFFFFSIVTGTPKRQFHKVRALYMQLRPICLF